MWARRYHASAPLTDIRSSKVKFEWTKTKQYALNEIKRVVAHDNLLAYPDFDEEFKILTDANDLQLGPVISQKGKPITLYIIKLTNAHKRYEVTEKDLLSIVETLKEFRTILLGKILIIYTHHKNLTCKHFNTDRLLRWRLILEEYGSDI